MTRLLVDPATDFDDPNPVTLTATLLDPGPALVRTFEAVTAATVVDLPAPGAAEAWRLTVRRPVTTITRWGTVSTNPGPIVEERTVHFAGTTPVAWAALTDVDPATLRTTAAPGAAWDAAIAELRAEIDGLPAGGGEGGTGGAVASVNTKTGAVVLAAGDVGADPAGAATTAQAFAVQRTNHTGTQSADTLTDGTTNKAFTATERGKLAGIAPGATANRADTATDAAIASATAALVNAAPGTLDTLGELATALQADEFAAATLTTLVGTKTAKAANLSDLADVAAARTNLGLNTAALQPVTAFATTADLAGKEPAGLSTGTKTALAARSDTKDTLGTSIAAFGDSQTAIGEPYIAYAAAISGGFRVTDVKSHPGYTSSQLVPLVTEITQATDKASACMVLCGANDAQGQVPLNIYSANVAAIVDALRDAGITPILGTVPPLSNLVYRSFQQTYNVWLQRYAAAQRLNLIPFASILSGPDGDWLPAYSFGDGIHQHNSGNKAMGQALASALRLPVTDGLLPTFTGGINLAPNGLFTADSNLDGIPDEFGLSPQTGLAYGLSTVAGVPGQVWTVTLNNVASSPVGVTGGQIDAGANTFAVGDRIRVAARVGAAQDGGSSNLQLTCFGAGYAGVKMNVPLFAIVGTGPFTRALNGGIVQQEFTVPAGTGLMVFQWALSGNGSYTAAQVGVWNLTKLGLA